MTLYGPEAVVRSIAKTLETYLDTELDDVWAQWATIDTIDGITVNNPGAPAQVQQGQRAIETEPLPNIHVFSTRGRVAGDVAYQDGSGWADNVHRFSIEWEVGDSTGYQAVKQALRFQRAIHQVLAKHPDLDGMLNGAPGTHLEDYQDGLLSGGGVIVRAGGRWDGWVELDEDA